MLEPVTSYVLDNEPCFLLTEMDAPKKGKPHRFRYTYVMRSDRIAKHTEDLGLSKNFKHDQFRIPGGAMDPITKRIWIEHSVAELLAIADQLRNSKGFNKEALVGTKIREA